MLAVVSAAFVRYNDAPPVTPANDTFLMVLLALAFFLPLVGLLLILQGWHAAWNGERLLRSPLRPISSVRPGHVVISGVIEPAWSVLESAFARRPSVYYRALMTQGAGKYKRTIFHERNAVPFILNDGTGRVLVLGRRARWDPGTSLLDLHGDDKAIAEGDTSGQIVGLLGERQLLPAPEPLAHRDIRKPGGSDRGDETEEVVAVGERVTVMGRAGADDRAVRPTDACLDDGASFGLPGLFRIAPEPLWGLGVTAGSPRDVTVRGRLRLVVGLIGVLLVAAGAMSAALMPTDHVLPPPGTIVFGTSFDSMSGVQGQAVTLSPSRPIVAVAKFNSVVGKFDQITVLVDGSPFATWMESSGKSGPGACEIDFTPGDLAPGQHQVDVRDADNTELASGTVAVGN